jgi:hypothetical protein
MSSNVAKNFFCRQTKNKKFIVYCQTTRCCHQMDELKEKKKAKVKNYFYLQMRPQQKIETLSECLEDNYLMEDLNHSTFRAVILNWWTGRQ